MAFKPTTVRFDTSLAAVVAIVVEAVGPTAVSKGDFTFLRDASGKITTIRLSDYAPVEETQIRSRLAMLGEYVDPGLPLATPSELYDSSLATLSSFRIAKVQLATGEIDCFVIDRRFVGGDWIRAAPKIRPSLPPIFTFASLKGGVGRSTALTICAHALSLEGVRVLAIDLDLEAPGLGSLLLPKENRPEFGTLDFFVEHGGSSFKDLEFGDLIEASPIITGGAPVYISPAFGKRSLDYPANVLGKIARAYNDESSDAGERLTFADRTQTLLHGLTSFRSFDVILIDARAGLHETSAASIIGLGADVLFFGTNQRQTFEGYLPLLSNIAQIVPDGKSMLNRIRMVHGRANLNNEKEIEGFRDSSHEMFSASLLYDKPEQTIDEFEFSRKTWFNADDPDGPHYPWVIEESAIHRLFDPSLSPQQLDPVSYTEPFGSLTENLRKTVEARLA